MNVSMEDRSPEETSRAKQGPRSLTFIIHKTILEPPTLKEGSFKSEDFVYISVCLSVVLYFILFVFS